MPPMHRTTPIERLQALLVSQIDPLRRPLIVEQMRAAAQIEVMAGLDEDDDQALAEWLGVTLKALSTG